MRRNGFSIASVDSKLMGVVVPEILSISVTLIEWHIGRRGNERDGVHVIGEVMVAPRVFTTF